MNFYFSPHSFTFNDIESLNLIRFAVLLTQILERNYFYLCINLALQFLLRNNYTSTLREAI